MKPSEFLTTLWGTQPPGLVQLWALAGRKSTYLRAPVAADAIATPGRPDLYTGVSLALRDLGRYRRATLPDIAAIAGLWLDIDVNGGPGHKTGAAPTNEAAQDLAHVLLEPTLLVHSGYGIHAWWLLPTPWRFRTVAERDRAQLMSAQWYQLHRDHAAGAGWTVDHTHDLSRVLRVPGTVNGKGDTERPVTLLAHTGRRYSLEQLQQLTDQAGPLTLTAAGGGGQLPDIQAPDGTALSDMKLTAAFVNVPEFAETFHHRRQGATSWSLSEYDLSLAGQAAAAGWTDQEIADLIVRHRHHHDPADTKGGRLDYLRRTIGKARSGGSRADAVEQLRALAAAGRPRRAA